MTTADMRSAVLRQVIDSLSYLLRQGKLACMLLKFSGVGDKAKRSTYCSTALSLQIKSKNPIDARRS